MISESLTKICGRFPSSCSGCVVGAALGLGGIERRQVIEHDAQGRHRVADADHRLEQRHARIRRVQHEVRLGESFEPADEVRVRGLLRDVASPEVSVADAAKQRVLVVALEVLGELGLVRFEIAHHADDDRIFLRDLEDPQVVLDPRARLDLDGTDHAERDRELPIALRVGCRRVARRADRRKARPAGDPGRTGECGCR